MLRVVETTPVPTGAAILPFIVQAMARGKDPICDSTRDGGILVSDEIVAIAADMEMVIATTYAGEHPRFLFALITEIDRATQKGEDPLEEVSHWLADCLRDETSRSA